MEIGHERFENVENERNMTVATGVPFDHMNQIDFRSVHNPKENGHHGHISFNLK